MFCSRVVRQLQCGRHNAIFVHDQYAGSSLSVLVNVDVALLRLRKYKLLKSIISYNSSNYTRCQNAKERIQNERLRFAVLSAILTKIFCISSSG